MVSPNQLSPPPCCDAPDCWLVGGMICIVWVLGLTMVMIDSTREAEGDVDGSGGGIGSSLVVVDRVLSGRWRKTRCFGVDGKHPSSPVFKCFFDLTLPN